MPSEEERHVAALVAELGAAVADLELGVLDRSDPRPEKWTQRGLSAVGLLRLAHMRNNDGYRRSSAIGAGGGHASGPSDPVGDAAARGDSDDVLVAWRYLIRDAKRALAALHGAVGTLARATPPAPTDAPPVCRVCGQADVHRVDRCAWCYRFWLTYSTDVPDEVLAARRDGRRITTALVAEALAPAPKRRGARR